MTKPNDPSSSPSTVFHHKPGSPFETKSEVASQEPTSLDISAPPQQPPLKASVTDIQPISAVKTEPQDEETALESNAFEDEEYEDERAEETLRGSEDYNLPKNPTTEQHLSPLSGLLPNPTEKLNNTPFEPASHHIHAPANTWMDIPDDLIEQARRRRPQRSPEARPELLSTTEEPAPLTEEQTRLLESPDAPMTPVKKQAPSPSSLKSQGETKVKSPATVILPPPTREKTSPSGILDQKAPASNAPRYRALERIGEGAMGEIWKAEDMTIGRTVAIKRRKPKLTREALNLFVEEARTTGQLEHSNIVTIHDMGVDHTDREYMVMRYIEGETLKDIITLLKEGDARTHKRFPINVRLQLMAQVLAALAYAHEKGIIHRDIKPANIMIGTHGEVTLMDWGISLIKPTSPTRDSAYPSDEMLRTLANQDFLSLLEEEHKRQETNPGDAALSLPKMLFGTPAYMAPEQLQSDSRSDERTDLYSFCVTLYEFLTLHHYLEGADTLLSILFGVQQNDPKPAEIFHHPLQGRIPREWSFVLQKGMHKKPSERYQTAHELLEVMQDNLRGDLTVGCTSTRVKQWGHSYLRLLDNHRISAVTFFCLFSLLALFGLFEVFRLLLF